MVGSAHRGCPLQRPEVGYVFNDDQHRLVAADIGADGAGIDGIDIAAARADLHLVVGIAHRIRERTEKLILLLDQMQRRPAGRPRPKTWHFCQKLDEFFDFGAGDSLCHVRCVAHMVWKRKPEANAPMKLLAICLGHAEKLPGKSYKTGINKQPVGAPVMIDAEGAVGDAVCNGKYHGGEEQAILLEGSVTLDWWSEQLGRSIPTGTFGENMVIERLDNRDVMVGDR